VVLLFVILSFLFFFFRALPGDYASQLMATGVTPEAAEQLRQKWGLTDPIHIQYFRYVINFVTLDAGISLQNQVPVVDYVSQRLFNTFILVGPGITVAYLLGSLYGALMGANPGSKLDDYGPIPIIFVGALPAFVTSIFLLVVFAGVFNLFPTGGLISVETRSAFQDAPWWRVYLTADFAWHYALPFVAVLMRYLFLPSLIMRTSVVEVTRSDFFRYIRIAGVPRLRRMRHMIKHASLPVITLYPVSMTRAIGGLVLIETVFNWPGIGAALVRAVLARDFPVVQFIFFLIAAFVVISNFAVDIVYGLIDPRVRIGED
jgi:peptide/nickel transport system permease protein